MNDLLINIRCLCHVYFKCFLKTLDTSRRYWWVLFTIFIYAILIFGIGVMMKPFGMFGGLVLGLAFDACMSSFLVMVESMVKQQKINFESFKKSFWVYFFDVMGVLFVYWIIDLVALDPLTRSGNFWAAYGIQWAILIFFNPVPELIYIAGVRAMGFFSAQLFSKAYEFIRDNWLEWYVPNLLVIVFLYYLMRLPWPFSPLLGGLVSTLMSAFSLYFLMIFRGLLFEALYRSSRRRRLFEYRARGTVG